MEGEGERREYPTGAERSAVVEEPERGPGRSTIGLRDDPVKDWPATRSMVRGIPRGRDSDLMKV